MCCNLYAKKNAEIESLDKREKTISSARLFYLYVLCATAGSIVRIIYLLQYPVQVRDAYVYQGFIKQWIESNEFPQISSLPPFGLYLFKVSQSFFDGNIFVGGLH